MTSNEVRKAYLDFFAGHGHRLLSSGSLLPENDPTTLFTGSGMQVLIPYLLGEPHPEGRRLADSQKCFRAEDIGEVGDNRHTTFFEMLGNWSLGDYFKEQQLEWCFRFLTDVLQLDPQRLYVTVFAGDKERAIPRDDESVAIWKRLFATKGVTADDVTLGSILTGSTAGMQGGRIFYYDATKNWWSRSGTPEQMPAGEPGGPDSEIFYEFTAIEHDRRYGEYCHPNCDCGRFLEIGNSVFMEYRKMPDNSFAPLPQRNVDFGGGLERLTAATNDNPDLFAIDTLGALIRGIERLSDQEYATAAVSLRRSFRVIADHVRAAVFLMADGALPSNKEQGYVVRRLLRRAIRHMDLLGMEALTLGSLVIKVAESYRAAYPEILRSVDEIADEVRIEEEKFRRTLQRGARELRKVVTMRCEQKDGRLTGRDLFTIYTTYGFPVELSLEEIEQVIVPAMGQIRPDFYHRQAILDSFAQEFARHQQRSRTDTEKKFHGGLADDSWECTQLHTATHLLHETLRRVLGVHVFQKGSNITKDRLRFDFSHPEKVTDEQLREVERCVNQSITDDLPVSWKEMTFSEAESLGALGLFESRYGERVKVYVMGEYSKEVCGGPHVAHTAQVGRFRITKEEAVSRGVRRIRAIVH